MRTVGRERLQRRGVAFCAAVATNLALVYVLIIGFAVVRVPALKSAPALQVFIMPSPARWTPHWPRRSFRIRLVAPRLDWTETVPDVRIDVPDVPTVPPQTATNSAVLAGAAANVQGRSEAPDSESQGTGFKIAYRVEPLYPPTSVRQREQGQVTMNVTIDAGGRVARVSLLRSSGFRRLDKAAVHAVRQWKFAPLAAGAEPDQSGIKLMLNFHLLPPSGLPAGLHTIVVPFDAVLAARIKSAIVAPDGAPAPAAPATDAVRHIAESLSLLADTAAAPQPPPQGVNSVAALGSVQSVRYMGATKRSLDVAVDGQEGPDGPQESRGANLWYVYEVNQERGLSEWLLAVAPNGAIVTLEIMTGH